MDIYTIKSLLFAGACSTLAVIIYHYIFLKLQEVRFHSAISELFEEPGNSIITPSNHNQPWSLSEDNLVISKAISDKELSSKTGRTVAAIHVRRNILKNK